MFDSEKIKYFVVLAALLNWSDIFKNVVSWITQRRLIEWIECLNQCYEFY